MIRRYYRQGGEEEEGKGEDNPFHWQIYKETNKQASKQQSGLMPG